MRVADTAAARQAARTPSSNDRPSAMLTASTPLKTSPAAVVSTAFTAGGDIRTDMAALCNKAPFAPKVMTTLATPRSRSTYHGGLTGRGFICHRHPRQKFGSKSIYYCPPGTANTKPAGSGSPKTGIPLADQVKGCIRGARLSTQP